MRRHAFLSILLSLIFILPASAQFSYSELDPASLRWSSIRADNYRIEFPVGCDSLARRYSSILEWENGFVGNSLGMKPGEFQKRPLPVLFHSLNSSSNGVVTWAPRRMELFTLPQWDEPCAMPWEYSLTIHENRHAAQMQFGYRNVFKPLGWLLGEMLPGALSGLYPGKLLLEGDAVVAETALSNSGRGRSAAFLQYYMLSFDNNQYRDWTRWRLGSYYKYTPGHYNFGYLVLSGIRTLYDAPLFMADYLDYVSRRPYNPYPFRTLLKKTSGKPFKESFPEIMHHHYLVWAADTSARRPFMDCEPLSSPRIQTEYGNPNNSPEGDFLYVKEDIYHTPALVAIDSAGVERRLFAVSGSIGKMNYDATDSTLIWNETVSDPRWGQRVKSVIKSYSFPRGGNVRQLTRDGSLVYPTEFNEVCLAAIRYLTEGGSRIAFVGKNTGEIFEEWDVPSFIQPVQVTSFDGRVFVAAICDRGYGIWEITPSGASEVLSPCPVQIASLENEDGDLTFESDYDGTWEFFRYEMASRTLRRLTSTRHGGCDYSLRPDGSLGWVRPSLNGSQAVYTPASEIQSTVVDWNNYHRYPIADALSAQEDALLEASAADLPRLAAIGVASGGGADAPVECSRSGWPKLHSWVPAWVDYDAISEMSFESLRKSASLGFMGFFQNERSTLGGYGGYEAKRTVDTTGVATWHHAAHLNLTFSGLYPVFEASVDFNDRNAIDYCMVEKRDTVGNKVRISQHLKSETLSKPSVRSTLRAYIPWRWYNGGVLTGLIPSAAIIYTNDSFEGKPNLLWYAGLRAYCMQPTPSAAVYPRWGIGAELRYADPLAFAYLYGYVPGFGAGGGFKLSALTQQVVNSGGIFLSSYANILPRGYADFAGAFYGGSKLTAEYAAPFYMGDWHIGTAFYCTRGIITPHFDVCFPTTESVGTLYSAGATFEMEFGAALWIRTPITVGITYSYNGGPGLSALGAKSHHYVGATFDIELPQ